MLGLYLRHLPSAAPIDDGDDSDPPPAAEIAISSASAVATDALSCALSEPAAVLRRWGGRCMVYRF